MGTLPLREKKFVNILVQSINMSTTRVCHGRMYAWKQPYLNYEVCKILSTRRIHMFVNITSKADKTGRFKQLIAGILPINLNWILVNHNRPRLTYAIYVVDEAACYDIRTLFIHLWSRAGSSCILAVVLNSFCSFV